MNLRSASLLAGGLCLLAGLGGCASPAATRPAPAPANREAENLDAHVVELEARIAELEGRIGSGRGAYSSGSLLRIADDRRSEPPLERLRRLERELADAKAQLSTRQARLDEITRELTQLRASGRAASERADDLSYAKDALITAQQALAERQAAADGLRAQLAQAELARLKAEREQYRIAARVLRLTPGQATPLVELQEEVRSSIRQIAATTQAASEAAPAAPAKPPASGRAPEHH
jgi:DNA repair exonuclease SbcCD ATPase subunit